MSKPFKNLIKEMPVERQKRIEQKAKILKNEMALAELRRALELTQGQLAKTMNMNQAAVSKFEHQSDLYISTLRKILSAMGAELKIVAQFPDADVVINQFTDLQNVEQRPENKLVTKSLEFEESKNNNLYDSSL